MPARILSRPEHNVSRKNIDSDALKVLYRLKNHRHLAYLVGGGVRDLLLERKPKDFDVGTSAHPQQVKKLFRNCFIVGRRFRLCHVRFGRKVIEVSTFRRQAEPEQQDDPLIRRDNTFGSPEEDAFRRDFTVNALFYDIASFSVIDYVGGLEDLEARLIRTIGDPAVRFREDPVRMLRAVALACRLGFSIDRDSVEAIRLLRGEIVKSSAARLLEEVYKILRQGSARRTFERLHELGLLAYILPEADAALSRDGESLLESLARLDGYRNASLAEVAVLTNPLLAGTLLVPLGLSLRGPAARRRSDAGAAEPAHGAPLDETAAEIELLDGEEPEGASGTDSSALVLPFAKRDLNRLRLILAAQRRLRRDDVGAGQVLAGRTYFDEALRWLEIHGGVEGRDLAARWRSVPPGAEEPATPPSRPSRRRRRRRRRAATSRRSSSTA